MTSDSQINRDQSGGLEACVTAWSPPPTIEELAGAEGNLMAELIQSFTADMEDRLQRIRGAMTSSNPAILRCEVHAIKGSSKQMAAFRVASVCEQI